MPLLIKYYDELPDPQGEDPKVWETRLRAALEKFKQRVAARYTEGTLQRLLHSSEVRARRATILSLGLLGTMKNSNAAVAGMLHDEDRGVRHLAADALWSLWFRADTDSHNRELQRMVNLRDRRKKRTGLDTLIGKA